MNTPRAALLLSLLHLTHLAAGQENPQLVAAPANVFIELQIVAIPQAPAVALVREFTDPAKAEGAYPTNPAASHRRYSEANRLADGHNPQRAACSRRGCN